MSTDLLEKLRASLSDRYDVERELGQGGMATVFLARDVRHERKVAIKVLHEDLGAALGAERFRREIQIATSLTHPHILALYDSGEAAGSLFYVMPFIEGESLRQRIDRESQLPIDKALKITGEVASALDYAHRKGVVHRDIKPENILLEDGHAIVADFGIARAVSTMNDVGALTKTGMSLGTPTYMSPEQSFGEKDIDGRSDLYSLACVLYEMLVGQPPFTGANAQAIMARHSMAEVPSMQIVRATIPDEVEDIVQKALAKAPADRHATVAEFAEELQECVIDYHTTTRRVVADRRTAPRIPAGRRLTEEYPVAKPHKKKWLIPAAAAAAVLVLGAGGWFVWGRGTATSAAGAFPNNKVAVLYFRDTDPSGGLSYLADGLTESLIGRLSEGDGIDVISQSGVAAYRGKAGEGVTTDSIARAFQAGTIVRGTVEAKSDQVVIKVSMLDGNTGEPLRTEEFSQPRTNILAAQDSVAARVATLLRRRVGDRVQLQSARSGTSNAAAWTLFQRGQTLRKDAEAQIERADAAGAERTLSEADSLFAQAASMDARWNEPLVARSAISLTRAIAAENSREAKPWIEKGIRDVDVVIARSGRDAGALETRGTLRYYAWAYSLGTTPTEREALLDGAESDLRTSTEIDPTRASAWNRLSAVYSQKDNTAQAKIAATRAYESDAYLTGTDAVLWRLYATSYDLEQFNDAVRYCDDGAKRFPSNFRFIRCKLWLQTVGSVPADPSLAWRDYEKLKSVASADEWKALQHEAKMLVGASLGRAGATDSARNVIASARPKPEDDKEGEIAGLEAFIRTLLGTKQDTTEAFNILGRYVAGSPHHREGLANSQSWWWRDLKRDSRFPR